VATLIDSSVLVAAERGGLDLEASSRASGEPLALPAIAVSELLYGVHRAAGAALRHRREAFVEGLLTKVPVVAFDLPAARSHARLWSDLARRGVTIGAHDLLIAATALAGGYAVATRDERSFPKVPGLTVRRW
jgi:tRNA(fMet)-specific endonuclease VapC